MAVLEGLSEVQQDSFVAGAIPSTARHLIDAQGVYDLQNGLYDDDGSIYRRGGSVYKSNAAFGTSCRWVWDGVFAAGQRTVFASTSAFGVLDSDDATPVSLGGAGLAEPVSAAMVGGILFIGGGTMYAGSRKAADYSTGTVSVTQGSKVVTGSGTTWLANVDPGMLLRLAGSYYVVASVDSNTQVTLAEGYLGATAATQSYTLTRLGAAGSHVNSPTPGAVTASIYATVAGRLIACVGSKVMFSEGVDAGTGTGTSLAARVGAFRTFSFPVRNVQEMPEGASIVGAMAVGSRLLVLTTAGVWVLSNMGLNITDASGNLQQRVEQVSDVVGWGPPGVTPWEQTLVVACTDGVYALDGISRPLPLARAITPKLVAYVRAGHKPGGAGVYKSHLVLPVLDASNDVVDMLICRLDRTVKTRQGDVFPWSFADGHGGNVACVAPRAAAGAQRLPDLLGVGGPRVLRLGGFWEPTAAVKNDADGSTHNLDLVTRDYATGADGIFNLVRLLKLWYELVDAGSDDPTLSVYYATGPEQAGLPKWGEVTWGEFTWFDSSLAEFVHLASNAPESDGRQPYVWGPDKGMSAHTRFIRFRVRSSGPSAKLALRSLAFYSRLSGRQVS